MRLINDRIEMPRMTPGMTSGVSMSTDRACLPGNRKRSMRNALAVPTARERAVTQLATTTLVQMLPSNSESWKSPTRPEDWLPTNQSNVKPRQGGAG